MSPAEAYSTAPGGNTSIRGEWKIRVPAVGGALSAPAIRSGDMVVFFEGREAIGFDRMKAKGIWQCRHGAFHHDEIVGKPFGSRVFSRSTKGYVYALSGTPELWSHVVPNRTQIVQDFDQSIVIFRLDLKPGDVVIESGTGSGVMSSAIMRTIAPSGFLHSFEFNEIRATTAQEEFENNGLGGLAKVVHRDVCAGRAKGGGFGEELDGKADAVFLDLPEPWLAVEHARLALKGGKKVCSYSPCIEQVMKTCEALRLEGFHSVTTIEFRLRTINYAEVQLEVPDFGSHHAPVQGPAQSSASKSRTGESGATASANDVDSASPEPVVGSIAVGGDKVETGRIVAAVENRTGGNGRDGSEGVLAVSESVSESASEVTSNTTPCSSAVDGVDSAKELSGSNSLTSLALLGGREDGVENGASVVVRDHRDGGDAVGSQGGSPAEAGFGDSSAVDRVTAVDSAKKRPRQEDEEGKAALHVAHVGRGRNERLQPKAITRAAEAAAVLRGGVRKPPSRLLCAQPYPTMRGHTAFLTFATTPVARRPEAAATAAQNASSAGGGSSAPSSSAAQSVHPAGGASSVPGSSVVE